MKSTDIARLLFVLVLTCAVAACARPGPHGRLASGGGQDDMLAEGRMIGTETAARMIDRARALETENGCAEAVPTYRVLASYGRNFEIAQYELSRCLLSSDAPALDVAEAVVWLERAALAGHSPSQKLLATTLAETGLYQPALAWAIVFNTDNGKAITPVADLTPAFMQQLESRLSPEQIAEAEEFALDFSREYMTAFKIPEGLGQDAQGRGGPGGGGPGRPPRMSDEHYSGD